MNRSWIIALAFLITLTASISTLGAGSDFTVPRCSKWTRGKV